MTQYSAPTGIRLGPKVSGSGLFTPVGTQAPVWQTLPAQFQQTQGTSINFASLCSDPQSFTLVFTISANSAFSAAQLSAAGITLASNGLMTIASNATLQTLNGIIVNANNQHGQNTDSAAFAIAVVASNLAWTLYRNYTLVNSALVAGTNPQVLGPFVSFAAAKAASIDSASNPDIIIVLAGNYPNDPISVDRNLIVACLGVQTQSDGWNNATMATVASYGDAFMPPLTKTVWLEGLRVVNHKVNGCTPSGASACIGMSVTNANRITINKCKFEECAAGIVTGSYTGTVTVIDSEFKNCGCSTSQSPTHSIYAVVAVSGNQPNVVPLNPNASITAIGCKFWFDQDWCSYPAGQEWRVGIGHYLKSDMLDTKVYGCYFRTTTPGGGGSVSGKVQGDLGGNWDISGNIMEEAKHSGYDPTDSAHGVVGWSSPGFPKCPTSAVTYTTGETKIIGIQPAGIQLGGGPFVWPASMVPGGAPFLRVTQNTIINNGQASEHVVQQLYNPPYSTAAYFSGGITIKDNVIAKNVGIADTDTWTTDGTNSLLADNSVFVSASQENYQLITPIAGSQNWAPYQYVFPIGHAARTDSYRGGLTPTTLLPDWYVNQPINAWIDVPNSRFDQLTLGGNYPTGAPTPPGPSNPYQPLPDFDPDAHNVVGSATAGLFGEFESDSGCAHSPALGAYFIGPSGGHTKTWTNASLYIIYRRNTAQIRGWRCWMPASKWKYINYLNTSTDPTAPQPGWPDPASVYGQYAYTDGHQISGQINRPQFVDLLNSIVASVGTNPYGGSGGFTWKLGPFVGSDPDFQTNPPSFARPPKFDGDPNSWTDFMWGEGSSSCIDQATGTFYVLCSNAVAYGGVFYRGLYKWTPSNTVKVAPIKIGSIQANNIGQSQFIGMCFDSKRNKLICFGNPNPDRAAAVPFARYYIDLDEQPNCVLRQVTLTGDVGVQQPGDGVNFGTLLYGTKYTPGLEFVPDLQGGDFYALFSEQTGLAGVANKNQYYTIYPPTQTYDLTAWTTQPWVVTKVTPSTANYPAPVASTGTCGGKWRYDPVMKGFLFMGDLWGGPGNPSPAMYLHAIRLA